MITKQRYPFTNIGRKTQKNAKISILSNESYLQITEFVTYIFIGIHVGVV